MTRVVHRVSWALGVEGVFGLAFLYYFAAWFCFHSEHGSTADGAVWNKSEMLKSRERLQTRLVFAEKESRGSWFLFWCVNLRAPVGIETACFTLSSLIPWAGKERNPVLASVHSVGWDQNHSEKALSFSSNLQIAVIHVRLNNWEKKGAPSFTCICWEETGSWRNAPTCSLYCKLNITIDVGILVNRCPRWAISWPFLHMILEAPGRQIQTCFPDCKPTKGIGRVVVHRPIVQRHVRERGK